MPSKSDIFRRIDRRTTLKGLAAAVGIAGFGGQATADPGGAGNGNGNENGADVVVNPNSPNHPDTINGGIEEASEGDTVKVTPSTYEEHVVVDKKITLKGVNREKVTVNAPDGEPYAVEVTADGATVQGLTARDATDGDAEGLTAAGTEDVTLERLIIEDNDDRGLTVGNTVNATVRDVIARNNGNDGITFWKAEDGLVENVEAHDNDDNGIYVNGPGHTVRDSVAYGNSDQGIDASMDHDVSGGDDKEWGGVTIENCESYDNDNGGIEVEDDEGDATVKDCHTHDNDIASNNDASGLVINNTSSIELASGTFEDGIAVNGIDTDP